MTTQRSAAGVTMMRGVMVLGTALVVSLAACSKDRKKADATAAPDTAVTMSMKTPVDSLHRPIGRVIRYESARDTVTVDGKDQSFPVALVTSPDIFPMKFATYRTEDMQVGTAKFGSTASMTFTPMLRKEQTADAYVQIQVDTTTVPGDDPAGAMIGAMTQGPNIKDASVTASSEYPWAQSAKKFSYSTSDRKVAGTVIVGKRGPHTYRILIQSLAGDVGLMTPRARVLLEQWRWEDDYSYLIPSGRLTPVPAAPLPVVVKPGLSKVKPGLPGTR